MKTIIIDCGHGGIDFNNDYRTSPNKMFKFNENEIAYEGYFNRLIGKLLGNFLRKDFDVFYTISPNNPIDLSLSKRVKITNLFPAVDTILISLHSNASSNHKARGFEVFTTVGETKSDKLATIIYTKIEETFPNIRMRQDLSDGDVDKESQFYILRKTNCPAILLENLFFDNYEDYKLLKDNEFRTDLVKAIVKGIKKYFKDGN